ELPGAGRALVADSIAAILSALAGTSTVVSYVESASGVEAGGRTGLTAIATAGLMLLALCFTPLILMVPAAATAPVLGVVGVFMLQSVTEIDMADFRTAAPAALTLIGIPLTFSIAEGLGFGLIAAAVPASASGKPRMLSVTGYVIAAVFLLESFHLFPFGGWSLPGIASGLESDAGSAVSSSHDTRGDRTELRPDCRSLERRSLQSP